MGKEKKTGNGCRIKKKMRGHGRTVKKCVYAPGVRFVELETLYVLYPPSFRMDGWVGRVAILILLCGMLAHVLHTYSQLYLTP